jgi:SAM-dependent methyltransferase
MDKHWTEHMFLDKPDIFLSELEEREKNSEREVDALVSIFEECSIPHDAKILDVPCGIGRHSVLLAEKGYNVVGVDISPKYIERANEKAHEDDVKGRISFKIGDMRSISSIVEDLSPFDVVLNLFTSIGYWDRETDRDLFRQLHGLTKKDGVFIIDGVNRDYLIRFFQPYNIEYKDDGVILIQERLLNLEESRMYTQWKYYRADGENLVHLETFDLIHIVYSLHELKAMLEESGWTFLKAYGGFDLSPLRIRSNRMITISKKTV